MLTYLKKFQTFHMPNDQTVEALDLQYIDPDAQGIDGPIQASYKHAVHALDKAWVDTFRNLGYQMNGDTMSGKSLGGYQIVSSIDPKTRQRSHAGNAYLDSAKSRPNLDIVTDVIVDKVSITTSLPKRASGVQFWQNGQKYTVSASKEVIICAGAIGSPCILQRSGIGGRQLLDRLEIDVIVENDHVGKNLQDHIMAGVSFEVKDGVETLDIFRDPVCIGAAVSQYQKDRTGPMADSPVSFAYLPLRQQDAASVTDSLSDLIEEHLRDKDGKSSEALVRKMLEDESEASANMCMMLSQAHPERTTVKDAFALTDSGNYITLFTALAHPVSRGLVHCTSSAANATPHIDPAYYSHPLDLELMSRHVQVFDKVVQTEPMKSMLKPDGRRIPAWADFRSLEEIKKLVQYSCMSNLHSCGSRAMLPEMKGGVVDHQLKVYGVSGLRVCDASIMPLIPRGNIQSSVYAIAEKAADIIKHDLARK